MSAKWIFLSLTIPIAWTKRYVRNRPLSIREGLRRERNKHHRKIRRSNVLIKDMVKIKRSRLMINKPKRQNFNSFYRPIELPY